MIWRVLLLTALIAALGYQFWYAAESSQAAQRVAAGVERVAALNDQSATILACGSLLRDYPFSSMSFKLRRQLASDPEAESVRAALASPNPHSLARLGGQPFMGPESLAALALGVLLLLAMIRGSRCVSLAALILSTTCLALHYGLVPVHLPEVQRILFSGFPMLCVGVTLLAIHSTAIGLLTRPHHTQARRLARKAG